MPAVKQAVKKPFQSNSVWLFRNIQTNQVIFSPYRVLRYDSALKQFPTPQADMFPLKIRKDLWIPLVHAIFPDHLIANKIYKKLLDYRAWRLTAPPTPAQMLLSKKRRNAEAKNQVPTSIADLAHITRQVPGRMIMNWHHFRERHWARGWAANIYHSPKGFDLVNGYKLEKYTFPTVTAGVRRKLGWEESRGEPPRNLKEAVEQHTRIYGAMHRGMKRKRKIAVRKNALVAKRGTPNLKKRAARAKQIRKRGVVGR